MSGGVVSGREALVERLAEHEWLRWIGRCLCGWEPTYPESGAPDEPDVEMPQWREHVAQALLPVVEQEIVVARAEARAELLDVLATACDECHGTGQSVQGWTDKNGHSENQYGPCHACAERAALAPQDPA